MATSITMSHRIGDSNVSETSYNHDDDHDNSSKEKRKERAVGQGRIHCKGEEVQRQKALPDLWQTAMSEHIDTRNKIKDIADISSFTVLLNKSTLSDEDKQLLQLHYVQHKDFRYIGDMLGYSEQTIKRRHKKALIKLSKLL